MGSSFNQLRLLLWKNYILQKRRPVATVIELLIPLLFSAILVIVRTEISVTYYSESKKWPSFPINNLPKFDISVLPQDGTWNIAYAPDNIDSINQVMENAKNHLNDMPLPQNTEFCGLSCQLQRVLLMGNSNISQMNANMNGSMNGMPGQNGSQNANRMQMSYGSILQQMQEDFENQLEQSNSTEDVTFSMTIRGVSLTPIVRLVPFASEDLFLDYANNDTNLKNTLAGVIFRGDLVNGSLPEDLNLIFRFHSDPINSNGGSAVSGVRNTWRTNLRFPGFQLPGPRESSKFDGGQPFYHKEGFLALMHAVSMGISDAFAMGSVPDMSFLMQRYPYPPYIDDTFIVVIKSTWPLLVMLSFFYTSLVIVRSVVQEKEAKMKEYMMMMGLHSWLHWLAWFLKYIIFLCISCILMAIFYKIQTSKGSVLTHSDPTVIFAFLILFSAATINLCFLFSVFFSKANVGAIAGGTLYGLTYMPYFFMENTFDTLSYGVKIVSCLLSNVAMACGCQLIGQFEGKGTGIQWNNIAKGVTIDGSFTLLDVMGMLVLDAVVYMLLAVYIEGIWPGEYGIPKPWYFPFMKSFWFERPDSTSKSDEEDGHTNSTSSDHHQGEDNEFFEDEPVNLKRVVQIKSLRKVFKSGANEKVAVDNLTLNMFEKQITVLLGHNGAGKTTTMSMLTGFFPPTSGDALVDGHSISKDMKGVRKSLGLCPQFNILFDMLTVDEHLYFFGRLKGLSKKEANEECSKMKEILKLKDKASARSSTLSGGMKRKLSVGIALSAGSKYVILDEPTSGMDPAARRAIWEVLQEYRSRCSMLLSTHFMDEADLLGDRIAIMAKGKLRCVGSSVFLKNMFGVGYHIVLTKTSDCNVNKLTELFQSNVPETRLERSAGAELSFVLPFQASPQFPKLFQTLDSQAVSLGISGFGAMVTTMEEVFLRVTENADSDVKSVSTRLSMTKSLRRFSEEESKNETEDISEPLNGHKEYLHTSRHLNSGFVLWMQQFYALVVKRILHSRRNYKVAIAQILIPVFFAIISVLNATFPPYELKNSPLDLSLDEYGPSQVHINSDSRSLELSDAYANQFPSTGSLGEVVYVNEDMQTYLANKYLEMGGDFSSRNLVSYTFSETSSANATNATAWFNAQAYHTSATSLAYLDQAYIRMVTQRNFAIRYVNYPLPRNSTQRVEEEQLGSMTGFLIAFNIVLGFSFLAASFCLFLIRERIDRSALLQTLAGVDPFCFWLSAFVWDFVNFIIPCLLTVIVFAAFSVDEFTNHTGEVLFLFALYCWSSLPLMYLLSLFFDVPSTALVRVTILNIITGLASIVTMTILRLLQLTDIADSINWFFLLMPSFCLGQGLGDLYTNHKMVNTCTESSFMEEQCEAAGFAFQVNFLAWEQYGIGKMVLFLAIQGFLFFAVLFMIEFHIPQMVWKVVLQVKKKFIQQVDDQQANYDDDDVANEHDRINLTELPHLVSSDRLIVKNLRKVYGYRHNKFVAVNNLCLGVPEGECFGLLGINGAGKTTTFKMLTGDFRPTSGTAYLDGYDISTQMRKVQQRMGYCPQFDALIEQMTGTETLRMFARLRGVPESDIPACIKNLSEILHFGEHLDKNCGTYSGGNKRKLSTAIALVGNPPVVLLDEPSTGMDPGARRMLWDALTSVRASGRSIIITSHSMEECEALCTRLAIMVNGNLRCIGGPQHLKTKFGQGYTMEVKTSNRDVKGHFESAFPGIVLKDEHQGLLSYHIPQYNQESSELKLAEVFERMENARDLHNFGDYTVTQTTLEQVFLSLVKWQRETE
ncbi:phospholipid-transporting ATPase ABCA3-like isoform X1 [Clavelina lepadiformis]|uniref:phospholipid-transporting ATPase ABCA3-like isoform X1 n=1 Tax=Clavelina lepadiformis TaxID=159417 RepID=UPI004040EDFE